MSGHSKWSKIKHKKAATDGKKSKLFGQLAHDIKQAARGGNDTAANAPLREAVDRAKKMNLPQGNIDRLLADTSNTSKSATYEGYGPGGVALMITAETNNTNRTVAEIRKILKDYGGNLGEVGSVQWQFSLRVVVEAEVESNDHDQVELVLIDAGADSIIWEENTVTVVAAPAERSLIEAALETLPAQIISTELAEVAPDKQKIALDPIIAEQFSALLDALADHQDVVSVFHNGSSIK